MTLSKSRLTLSLPFFFLFGAVIALYFAFTLPIVSYWASRAAWRGGFPRQAEALLLRSLEKEPTQKGFAFLVQVSLSRGNYRKADWAAKQWAQTFPSAIKENPNQMANLYIEMGKEALRKYDWQSVQEFYKQALVYGATQQLFRELGRTAKAAAIEAIKEAKFERFFALAKLAHRFGEKEDKSYRDTARQAFYDFLKLHRLKAGEGILDLLRWLHEEEDVVQSLQWDLGFEMGKIGFLKNQRRWKEKGWELLLHSSPLEQLESKSLFLSFPFPFWKSKAEYLLPHPEMLLKSKARLKALHPLSGGKVLLIEEGQVSLLDRIAGVVKLLYANVQDVLEGRGYLYLIVPALSPKGMEESEMGYQLLQYNDQTASEKRVIRVKGRRMYWCDLHKICVIGKGYIEVITLPTGRKKVINTRFPLFYIDDVLLFLKQKAEETMGVTALGKVIFQKKGNLACTFYTSSFLLCREGEKTFLLGLHKMYELSASGEMAFASDIASALLCCKESAILGDSFQREKQPVFISLPIAPQLSFPSTHLDLKQKGTYAYVQSIRISQPKRSTTLHAIWVERQGKISVTQLTFRSISLLRLSPDEQNLFFVLTGKAHDYLMVADLDAQRSFSPLKSVALPQSEQKIYWFLRSLATIEDPQKNDLETYRTAVRLLYGKPG